MRRQVDAEADTETMNKVERGYEKLTDKAVKEAEVDVETNWETGTETDAATAVATNKDMNTETSVWWWRGKILTGTLISINIQIRLRKILTSSVSLSFPKIREAT